ncbi:hypothetical protein HMPREF3056_10350 [Corynebacterium sp. HMSC056F09]|uniref:AAA family ATPase n=1 Tax=Corynebacterium sp. HMSC056F09 TaxID=1739548 RepID=UPI0008A162D4|nr:AAA family ATPase [Corynebacterium sp. HMSC056F09]OFO20185.1 hypothetical protein HMPREF3056_10350 [Corynebacterium sp. HMSC056F09]
MSRSLKAKIYYGPPSWFEEQTDTIGSESFLDIVYERDSRARELVIVQRDASPTEDQDPVERPEYVVVNSGDYASLVEATISNFGGLIRSIDPKNIYLNNPPQVVRSHVQRIAEVTEIHYEYGGFSPQLLREFYDDFNDHLVGQSSVKDELLAAMYPLACQKENRPVVVMFYGPSGVGKTETAKFISKLAGGDLFRKQFSMLHSEKFASYVFGGSHQEPSLAHDLMERESNVILFDEFDKASPVFHSAFYELFDEGVLEDKNYRTKVGSPLIICTSNYGSEEAVKKALGEALYSRFNAFIEFHPLSVEEVSLIADQLIDSKVGKLDSTEQAQLNVDSLRTQMKQYAGQLGNVRKLSSSIDQVIGFELATSLLKNTQSERP